MDKHIKFEWRGTQEEDGVEWERDINIKGATAEETIGKLVIAILHIAEINKENEHEEE